MQAIVGHRNHYIVGSSVHEATSQAINYLRGLDELGPALETTHRNEGNEDYDMRRTFATVVIGHPTHVSGEINERTIDQTTIRSYNAHLSRIAVLTYRDFLYSAKQALAFEEDPRGQFAYDDLPF